MTTLLFIAYFIIFALMFISIILFENNSKKIIFWGLIISLTSIFGYVIYFIFYSDRGYIKKYLHIKANEDAIYKKLVKNEINSNISKCELMNFAKKYYEVNHYRNSYMQMIKSNEEFNTILFNDIDKAERFVIIDTRFFLNSINPELIVASLIEKRKMGVTVKVIYSQKKFKDRILIKQLKLNGIRVCKFNKTSSSNGYYRNNKNIISIDGKTSYIYSHFTMNVKKKMQIEYFDLYYRLTGEIVKSTDLEAHLDVTFATKKYYAIQSYPLTNINSDVEYQYIGSNINNNLLDLILKAIIEAKSSLFIHVDKFIPNESVLEAIKLAVKSNIKVKLMISNVNHQYGYYTSRSYVKELAREGVTCYFYDGHINSNYVVIDESITMIGSFSFVNQSLMCDLQDVLLICDNKIALNFVSEFNNSINNSFKLCNPKRVLFREKFFRKFM